MGRGCNNFYGQGRKNLERCEQTVRRNADVNYSASKDSEGSEEHGRENIQQFGKYLNYQ